MTLSFDLQKEITQRLSEVFHSMIDIRNLKIELTASYPKNYKTIFQKMIDNDKIGIENYYGRYLVGQQKVVLVLPLISEPCSRISHSFDHFIRIIAFFEISQWVTHTMKWNEKVLSDKKFRKTGKIYRNFMALLYTFELVKYDELLIEEFSEVVRSLSKEYTLCLAFIRDDKYRLPGVELTEIIEFNRKVIELEWKTVTKKDILEFGGFNHYIHNSIERNPFAIDFFRDSMTDTQKKQWSHLSEEYGFISK
jgi:hypothetical protein